MNSILLTDQPIFGYGIALGIGLLIGAERERHKGTGPTRSLMGIRTFATAALLGAVSCEFIARRSDTAGCHSLGYCRAPFGSVMSKTQA